MKLGRLFLIGTIALGLGLTACNNDAPEVEKQDGIGTLTVNIVQAGAPATKLTGDLDDPGNTPPGLDAEKEIKSIEVWVFANGNLEQYETGTTSPIQIDGLTAGNKAVAVVVNGNIGAKSTLTLLKDETNTLSQDLFGEGKPGMLMSWIDESVNLVKCPIEEPAQDCNEITAEVERVNARVALVGVTTDFDTDAPYKSFELEEVVMFNVRETSKVFDVSPFAATKFLYGVRYPSALGSYVGHPGCPAAGMPPYAGTLPHGVEATLKETLTQPLNVTNTPLTIENAKYFYVHENDATPKQGTILVLKGKLKDENGDVYKLETVCTDDQGNSYYAIWVNANKDGYTYATGYTPDGTIARNTQYNIEVTLTRAGSPTIDPLDLACLTVTVNVKEWTVVNQNVTW